MKRFLYTARERFSKDYLPTQSQFAGLSWEGYLGWSRAYHLSELVSVDNMLSVIEPDYNNADDWNYIHIHGQIQSGFFTSPDYVCKRVKNRAKYNLLMVAIEPILDCKSIDVDDGYEFVGYDLLDQYFSISPLTNCGGDKGLGYNTFLPTELNDKGLLDDFGKAYDIKKRLLENNPTEAGSHAKANVIAVWRHRTVGR